MSNIVEHLAEFISQISTPTQAAVAVLLIVGVVIYGLFKPESGWMKLIAFSGLLLVSGGVLVTIHHYYHEFGDQARPNTAGEVASESSTRTAFEGMAMFPSPLHGWKRMEIASAGWIFGGRYDAKERRWIEKNISVLGNSTVGLPGQGDRVRTLADLQLYDKQPKFTAFGLKWKLGTPIRDIPSGTVLTVLANCLSIETNVWCSVADEH